MTTLPDTRTTPDRKPETCPPWCDGDRWHNLDSLDEPTIEHGAEVAGGFLPEVRRIPGLVTRPAVGSWEITVIRRDHMADHDDLDHYPPLVAGAVGWGDDALVELCYTRRGEKPVTLALLPGEALQLARALTRGADLL